MNQVKKILIGTALASMSLSAMAAHVPGVGFSEESFTFDATAFGGGAATDLKFIDFSYTGEIDQVGAAGTFSETGGGFFGSFRTTLGGAPINNGLGIGYNMYALFSATGTQAAGGGGGIDATFTTFDVEFFIDDDLDTVLSVPTLGIAGGDESVVAAGTTADDVSILSGSLIVGGAHVFPGLAAGDFDVQFLVDSFDASVWKGDAFIGSGTVGDFNGVNTSIAGIPGAAVDVTDGLLTGSGNTSFTAVPEPATLALLSLGLMGMGGMSRRRNNKNG